MAKKVTPDEVYQVFKQAVSTLPPEGQAFYGHLPDTLQDLSDEQRRNVEVMTLKMNCIVGEFEVEQGK